MEVGGREPRLRVALDLLVEARVAVGEVLEGHVELRVQREVEVRRLGRVGAHRRVARLLVDDVVLRPPAAHVVGEDHVRRHRIPQADPLLREGGAERDGVRLLDVTPEVGLDVHDDRLRAAHALEQQLHIGPVGLHQRRVAQVREVCRRLVAARALRLQQLVVGQHRDLAVRPRLLHVHRGERAVRIPVRPAVAGVHAAGQVLVAEAERRRLAERRRTARRVAEAELHRRRPAVRERRQLRRGGRGERQSGEQRQRESACPLRRRSRGKPT